MRVITKVDIGELGIACLLSESIQVLDKHWWRRLPSSLHLVVDVNQYPRASPC